MQSRAGAPALHLWLRFWIHPQPAVIFRRYCQTSSYWILPEVFALVFEDFIRSQDVIERLFFPHGARTLEEFVDAMSGGAFQALQDID